MSDESRYDSFAAPSGQSTEIAVLGGGCFWCTEAVFQNVRGVTEVVPGYCGGHMDHPDYRSVCTGESGHIEVVQVTFDPKVINYESILQIFFATHDPTTLNRQGADVGPQYASAIFYQGDVQKEVATRVIAEVEALLGRKVVTQLRNGENFWIAEPEHHAFYERNPWQGYCRAVIQPKLQVFRKNFSGYLKSE